MDSLAASRLLWVDPDPPSSVTQPPSRQPTAGQVAAPRERRSQAGTMEEGSYSEVPVEPPLRRWRCGRQGVKLALLGLLTAALWAGLLSLLLLWHWDTVQSLKQLEDTAAQNVSQVSKALKQQDAEFSRNLDRVVENLSNLKSLGLNERRRAFESLERLRLEVDKLWVELREANGSRCGSCPEQWVNFRRKCYYFGQGSKKWVQARNACRGLQGQLVSIHSQQEQDFLTRHVSRTGSWIGLRDLDIEGEFVWMDGNPLDYSNWGPGEPNNGGQGEDCVMMQGSGQWNDAFCYSPLDSWVCDRLATC
ncbi:PREDICTED: low affinity immunoglobulin epsilon Fc receptor [Condylura cristata]|uniref:low affinity immunoglobulin epsilon Fc receptor n=1 Tax=Condylura cristata TaxID=143302 RepID=UPI00064381C4|nr:PREDICTED: low affinity immunoglobulin epsilon Fc receptor [Condylura cristata]